MNGLLNSSFRHALPALAAAALGLAVAGCASVTVLESGSPRIRDEACFRQLMPRFKLGMSEDEVMRIMGSRPASRWEDPDFKQVVCFWFFSRTELDSPDVALRYKAHSCWFKFEDGQLVGVELDKPKYMMGDVVYSEDAWWHYRTHVSPMMCKAFYVLEGKRYFFNEEDRCYIVAETTKVVDHWEGTTCHWKSKPLKSGYKRVRSPDDYYIDIPEGKTATYLGNGKFSITSNNAGTGAQMGPATSTVGGGDSGNAALNFAGVLAGAFIQGAAEGMVQGLTQGLVNSATGGRAPAGGPVMRSSPSSKNGGGGAPKKSAVKPRVKHSYCHGTGDCQICKRKGYVGTNIKCTGCGGSGRCRACRGTGWAN